MCAGPAGPEEPLVLFWKQFLTQFQEGRPDFSAGLDYFSLFQFRGVKMEAAAEKYRG